MSLARAFTKRLQRTESKRPQISAPALITSTNAASYNAPDVATAQKNPTQPPYSTPRSSSEKSESGSEEPTLTDGSSVEPSPVHSPTVEHNHLSCYFPGPTKVPQSTKPVDDAPTVPRRAPSHSKREHERLSRARSFRSSARLSSTPSTPELSAGSLRDSEEYPVLTTMRSVPSLKGIHPFSNELEQLSEVAEELEKGSRAVEKDIDESVMQRMGLAKFSAEDYIFEIKAGARSAFDDGEPDTIQWNSWI